MILEMMLYFRCRHFNKNCRTFSIDRIARDYYDNILRRLTAQPFPYSTCIYDIQNPVMQSKFHPKKNLLTTVNDKGYVSMYNFDINAFAMSKQFAIHTHAIFDFDWSPTDMDVATASGDSTTKIIRFLGI